VFEMIKKRATRELVFVQAKDWKHAAVAGSVEEKKQWGNGNG